MIDLFGIVAVIAGRLLGLYVAYRAIKFVYNTLKGKKKDEDEE